MKRSKEDYLPSDPSLVNLLKQITDEELMQRVALQDRDAFAVLLDRHVDGLHTYLYRLCHDRFETEDLVQETFFRIWDKAKTWKSGKVRFSTWLYRIGYHHYIDVVRRYKPEDKERNVDNEDGALTIESETNRQDHSALLNSLIHELPERQRTALVLCHIQGWSNAEAATVLDVSTEALESLLARARRALRKKLRSHLVELDP